MLRMNVGFSRKVGEENYGSRGASVNLELELESSLANNPPQLHDRIRELFALARNAVQEELQTPAERPETQPRQNTRRQNGNGGGRGRKATQSQVRALHAITKRQGVNLADLLDREYQLSRPEDLDLKQASELIDFLNGATAGAGGRR